MPCTDLKCLNTNFICYATQLPGGGEALFLIQNLIYFLGTIYTYKLFTSISPKASVENSSAQWAIFFYYNLSFETFT